MADKETKKRQRRPLSTPAKRRKREYDKEYNKMKKGSLINIQSEIDRWNLLKLEMKVVDDEQTATLLLDHYERWKLSTSSRNVTASGMKTPEKHVSASTSTPAVKNVEEVHLSEVSSIHGSDSNKGLSDIEPLPSCSTSKRRVDLNVSQHDITMDDIQMNITVGTNDGSRCLVEDIDFEQAGLTYDDDDKDSDYVPDTVKLHYENVNIDYEDLDVVGDDDNEMDDHLEEDYDEEEEITGTQASATFPDIILKDNLSISFDNQLLELSKLKIPEKCGNCASVINNRIQNIGTSTLINWECVRGHKIARWCSQPLIKKVRAGDFLLATCILLSGNNHAKVSSLFKFMNLGCVSASTFYRIQAHYCIPAINTFWEKMVQSTLDSLRGQDLVLLGDGQNDSPGHCAQYLNYNMIEESTGLLVHVNTIDKREADGKSVKMELVGFKRAVEALLADGQTIKEIVTDAHIQIKSYMSKEKPEIKHSNDIWHGAKSITKQISKASLKAENKYLIYWGKDVVNHFWYCAKNCDGNVDKMKAYWRGVLHHVVNKHEWISGDGLIEPKCLHDPLSPEYNEGKWLQKGSKPHMALEKIVLNSRFLKTLPYFVNFRHTGDIEMFHSFKLMYASKRHFYSPPAYNARCLLAAIDFNSHKNREPLKDAHGNIRHRKKYSKRSGSWTAVPLMSQKNYNYIPELIKSIIYLHLHSKTPLQSSKKMSDTDPRRISKSSAKVQAPSLEELVKKQKSRF